MFSAVKYYAILAVTVAIYFGVSKLIFDKVNEASPKVIDELFHLPQAKAYCKKKFTHWDEKITTFPGLYLIASCISDYYECNTYNLRFINLVGSVINLLLFSSILKFTYEKSSEGTLKIVLQALNLAILPPLYFYSHVFYTDTLSLSFLLMYTRCSLVKNHKGFLIIFAVCSVLMRQTNIVWVAMVFGQKVLDILVRSSRVFSNHYLTSLDIGKETRIAYNIDRAKLKQYYNLRDMYVAAIFHVKSLFRGTIKNITVHEFNYLAIHLVLFSFFISFVILNGSIVVGDKTAHTATIHLPQLFYFLIFYGVFGLIYVLNKAVLTFKAMLNNKLVVVSMLAVFLLIVHFNTIDHPYLLADNRHYTFYIWNRWFGKYFFAKYVSTVAYVFLAFNLYENLRHQNCISFLMSYSFCATLVLCLQRLIEVRYFLVPYLVLRLRFVRPSYTMVVLELVWYLLLNYVTFDIFFNKEIMWDDFSYPQRIIW